MLLFSLHFLLGKILQMLPVSESDSDNDQRTDTKVAGSDFSPIPILQLMSYCGYETELMEIILFRILACIDFKTKLEVVSMVEFIP